MSTVTFNDLITGVPERQNQDAMAMCAGADSEDLEERAAFTSGCRSLDLNMHQRGGCLSIPETRS